MNKLFSSFAFALAAYAVTALPASASQILIDFEHTPGADGILGTADDVPTPGTFLQPLRDQYASLGLRFTQGTLLQSTFFDGNASNHFISSTNPIAVLSQPVNGISIESFSFWDVTLTAYGIDGNVIASDRVANPNAGSAALRSILSVGGTQAIYGFSVLPDNSNYILNLDNLVLTTADAPGADVPEPPATALFALCASLAGWSLRRHGRKGG